MPVADEPPARDIIRESRIRLVKGDCSGEKKKAAKLRVHKQIGVWTKPLARRTLRVRRAPPAG
jgi:hypothetical protein